MPPWLKKLKMVESNDGYAFFLKQRTTVKNIKMIAVSLLNSKSEQEKSKYVLDTMDEKIARMHSLQSIVECVFEDIKMI